MDISSVFLLHLMLSVVTVVRSYSDSQSQLNFKRSGHLQSVITKRMMINYSKQDPPNNEKPTDVRIGIYVNSFYSINEQTMDYSVNVYLRQRWRDPRLAFSSPDNNLEEIKMDEGYWTKLWLPDTYFRNEKEASYHDVSVANRLLRINASGYVYYVSKISATLTCPMKLHKYPLDTQRCPMMFESFGYTTETMHYNWIDNPVDVDKGLQLPQFFLVDKVLTDCSWHNKDGSYSCLSVTFVLRRDLGYFLIQVYVPSILIVILSWVSFWINIDASPARVSLGLLTVLTTTTMSGGARESLPRVSYIKAIDVWMIMCLVFVFASLIEYALVNVAARHQPVKSTIRLSLLRAKAARQPPAAFANNSHKSTGRSATANESDKVEPAAAPPPKATPSDPEAAKRRARSIDKFSRKCFPLAFLAFNIVYWIIYTWPETGREHLPGDD